MSAETENGTEKLELLPPKMEAETDSIESECASYSPPSSGPPIKRPPPETSPQPSAPPQPPPQRKGPQTPPPQNTNGTKRTKPSREKQSQIKKSPQKYCYEYRNLKCLSGDCTLYHCSAEEEAYYKKNNKEPVCLKFFSGKCEKYLCKYRHISIEEFETEQSEFTSRLMILPPSQNYPLSVDTTQPPPKVEPVKIFDINGSVEPAVYQKTGFANNYIFGECAYLQKQVEDRKSKGLPEEIICIEALSEDGFHNIYGKANPTTTHVYDMPPPGSASYMTNNLQRGEQQLFAIDITQPPPGVRPNLEMPYAPNNAPVIVNMQNNSQNTHSNRNTSQLQGASPSMAVSQYIPFDITQPPPPVPDVHEPVSYNPSVPTNYSLNTPYRDPRIPKRHLTTTKKGEHSRTLPVNDNQGQSPYPDVKRFKHEDPQTEPLCVYCRKYDERKCMSMKMTVADYQQRTAETKILNQTLELELQRLKTKYKDYRLPSNFMQSANMNMQQTPSASLSALMPSSLSAMMPASLPTPMPAPLSTMLPAQLPTSEFCIFKEKLYKLQRYMQETLPNFPTEQQFAAMSGVIDNLPALEMIFNGQIKINDMNLAPLKEKLLLVKEAMNDVTKYFPTDSQRANNSTWNNQARNREQQMVYLTVNSHFTTYDQTQPTCSQVTGFAAPQSQQMFTSTARPMMSVSENQQVFSNAPQQQQELFNQQLLQTSQQITSNQQSLIQNQQLLPQALVQSLLAQQNLPDNMMDYNNQQRQQILNNRIQYNNYNSNQNMYIPPS